MKKLRRIAALLLSMILVLGSAAAATKTAYSFTLNGSETVTMVWPGPVYSVVKSDGESVAVLTENLSWDTEAPVGKRVALVSAPRSGRSVVMSKSTGGRTMGRISTGHYVVVLKKAAGKYTGVLYQGKLGYVLTSTLTYPDASQGVKLGVVCWTDGSTNGRKTINLREKTSRNSRKLGAVKTGVDVIVYGEKNGWTEVDVDGMHGYIQSQYISVTDEELAYPEAGEAEAAPTETPAAELAGTITEEEILTDDAAPVEEAPVEEDENPDDMEEFDEEEEGWDEGL